MLVIGQNAEEIDAKKVIIRYAEVHRISLWVMHGSLYLIVSYARVLVEKLSESKLHNKLTCIR